VGKLSLGKETEILLHFCVSLLPGISLSPLLCFSKKRMDSRLEKDVPKNSSFDPQENGLQTQIFVHG
jgi:hypothetical protein